jgi:23S rRNA pseudouridine2605 synthase
MTSLVKDRIQKVLANAGVASRRNVEEMVQQGRVAVNGRVMSQLPILVDPAKDKITVDDEPVRLREATREPHVYVLMNKPKGVYSTNVAQGEQRRAIDLLPPKFPRVYPVGRLDAESKGLLLLTNDGDLTNRLTHPRYGVAKTYRAVVDGYVHGDTLDQLKRGIWLADPKSGTGFKTGRSSIRIDKRTRNRTILEITIREGRNRQVRRMLAKIGHKVRELTRIRMGQLTLHGLEPGAFRLLNRREVRQLQDLPHERGTGEADDAPHAAHDDDERDHPPARAARATRDTRAGRAAPAARARPRPQRRPDRGAFIKEIDPPPDAVDTTD